MRALPFTFQGVEAPIGSLIQIEIEGDAGGQWFLERIDGEWIQRKNSNATAISRVSISQDSAWQLFTKRIDRDVARARFPDIRIEGNVEIGSHVIDMVSIMA